jgi:uncharacterized protein
MNKKLTNKECILLLKETNTPKNIFLHSRKVNAVAMFIALKMKETGEEINLDLVHNASLLHDIKKFESLKDREMHHEEDGERHLESKGFKDIAIVVGKHGSTKLLKGQVRTWEEKIVSYADARVQHNQIVSVDKRFNDLDARYKDIYPNVVERNKITKKLKKEIEKEIFAKLDINSEDINENTIKEYLIEDDY